MAKDDEIGAKQQHWPARGKNKSALAVALDYKNPSGRASSNTMPRIAASGRGAVAEQIIALAFERGIPVREDADLAEILSTVNVDSEIPIDALAAVAEILSYLYRYNRANGDDTAPRDTTTVQDEAAAHQPRQGDLP